MSDEILDVIDNFELSSEARFDASADLLNDCSDELAEVVVRFESVAESVTGLSDAFQTRLDELVEATNEWTVRVEDTLSDLRERVEDDRELATQMVVEGWAEMNEACGDLADDLESTFRQHLQERVSAALSESETAATDLVEDNLNQLLDLESRFRDAVNQALADLRRYVPEWLVRTMEDEVRKTGIAALDRVKQEVVDGVIESQVQVQLTAMLSSVLPQLIAAKAAAPAIRRALEIMRAGF